MWTALCLLLPLTLTLVSAVPADELSYAMIGAGNATGQYTIVTKLGNVNQPGNWTLVNCTNDNYGACPWEPVLEYGQGDLISVAYNLSNPKDANGTMKTYPSGSTPTMMYIKMCFAANSSIYRSWRTKNKAYPRLTQNCPVTLASIPWNGAQSGNITYNMDRDLENDAPIARGTWFIQIDTYCGADVCEFEQSKKYFQSNEDLGITTAIKIATGICSAIGPIFFIAFWIVDHHYYNKWGKPIMIC